MDRTRDYLFREHSEAVLREWARRLRLFRYFRAYGGHANDADSLDVAFRYDGEAELVRLLSLLGVQGEQPGHCTIFGKQVFIWCSKGIVKISASAGSWTVTEDHVRAAEELEQEFASLGPFEIVDPPRDTEHYFCPKYYPEWDWS